MRKVLLTIILATIPLRAQAPPSAIRVVLPNGPGGIPVHLGDGWGFQLLKVYPDGPRPVFQVNNEKLGLVASYILFANDTAAPTSEACRDAVTGPLLKGIQQTATVEDIKSDSFKTADGRTLLTTSYVIAKAKDTPIRQKNVFAFIGDPHNCAEIHLSKVAYTPSDDQLFNAELSQFRLDADYVPVTFDYFGMATLLFFKTHSPESAAPYYQRAFEVFPTDGKLSTRREITDQLSMAYGMSGNLVKSRAINEAAITIDPLYPLYYYNLACADAEAGDAKSARTHLEQAFARKANTLPGEKMPDPTKDDSFLKLKKDKDFWAFVQSLAQN